jgi:phage/plasmid-associated DNA primase
VLNGERAGKRRFAWNNGVFDFTTKIMMPFSPDIIMFFKLSHDNPTTEAARRSFEALFAEVRKRVVDDV